MENITVTLPLSDYSKLEIDKKASYEMIEALREKINELQRAKAVVITQRRTFDTDGIGIFQDETPRIYGKGVGLNKAIMQLQDEFDKLHISTEKRAREAHVCIREMNENNNKLESELKAIKSKWWYKLFN